MKNNFFYYMFLTIALFQFSCKKTKLEDDKVILAGKWTWTYSRCRVYSSSGGLQGITIINANNYEHQYKIEMLEKGKIKLWTDGKCKKHRILLDSYEYSQSLNGYEGSLSYDKYNHEGFYFKVYDRSIDTLYILRSFPFDNWTSPNGDQYNYDNYFIREQ